MWFSWLAPRSFRTGSEGGGAPGERKSSIWARIFAYAKRKYMKNGIRSRHEAPELLPERFMGCRKYTGNRFQEETSDYGQSGLLSYTAAILALAPALTKKLIKPESIIIDAKSGVSGAGRKLSLTPFFRSQ
jgi:hypothetical protein